MKPYSPGNAHKRTRAPCLTVFVLLALLIAACGQDDVATADPLQGSRWEMTTVWNGTEMTPAHPTTIATLTFTDGSAGGSTGCNLYVSSYTIDGNAIVFGDFSLTGFACDPEYVEQGNAFIAAIEESNRFTISDDTLELMDAGGAVQLRFRPATELPLAGITWRLTSYGDGTAPLDGSQISLAFRSDGTLVGIAGCNEYSADYQMDGDRLTMGPIAQTEMACQEPAGIMTQETDYLAALRQVRAFATSLTGLQLLDADGPPVAEYRFGGRVRDGDSHGADGSHDVEEAAFVGLTRRAAVELAEEQGRLWRISRVNDEFFALDAQLLHGRVTFEIDDGTVTSAAIEREDPPARQRNQTAPS